MRVPVVRNPPKVIYLNVGAIEQDCKFSELSKADVTWCADMVGDSDLRYVLALDAAAWLHTMHMEGGQKQREVTFDTENPWGEPGTNYSKEYRVTCVPLYALPATVRDEP